MLSSANSVVLTTDGLGESDDRGVLPLQGSFDTAPTETDVTAVPGIAQRIPTGITINTLDVHISTNVALSLVGSTIDIDATLYTASFGGPAIPTPLSCTTAPSLTGVLAIGTEAECTLTGAAFGLNATDRAWIVASASEFGIQTPTTIDVAMAVSIA